MISHSLTYEIRRAVHDKNAQGLACRMRQGRSNAHSVMVPAYSPPVGTIIPIGGQQA